MPRIKKNRKAPPSRIRYEKSHPVVSCRVTPEFFARLNEAKNVEGKSYTDILKLGLEGAETWNRDITEAEKVAEREAYDQGFKDAKQRYLISSPCAVCGQLIEVTDEGWKTLISEYLHQKSWRHSTCIQK